MSQDSPRSSRRRSARVLGGGALVALIGGGIAPVAAPAAAAAETPYTQDFASATDALTGPEGWEVARENTDGMREGWQGWTFHTVDEVVGEFGDGGQHSGFTRADGVVAVVQSDGNRPASGTFESALWAPEYELTDGAEAVRVAFDSHYRQGQNPPAQVVARFDDGDPVVVETFAADRRDEAVDVAVDVPAGAESVRIGWEYGPSSNNWYWMIDDVEISEAEAPDAAPVLESAKKPVAAPGESVTVRLSGLRAGQQLEGVLGEGEAAAAVPGIDPADDAGEVAFDVAIPADQAAGTAPLALTGEGVEPLSVGITVLPERAASGSATEPQLWFDGFEGDDAWTREGSSEWRLTTRDAVVEAHGTDRRQAFTRGSGTIAVAETADGAFDGALTSEPVAVEGGESLELRFDSHFRARGGDEVGTVTAAFDDGSAQTIGELTEDEESAQPRLAFDVPDGAEAVSFSFAFAGNAGTGSWMIDDVHVVEPLPVLADGAEPRARLDVFSDVQGSNDRLGQNVVPGFAALDGGRADVILSNGDQTGQGTSDQYDAYLAALQSGGGDDYEAVVSTIGNHEFYGGDGSDAYIQRFLDRTGMRDLGVEGSQSENRGLWGEMLVDDALPLLWIGSEDHDYPSQTGSGPFVDLSDEQFHWLRERLDHYAAESTPVLLASHHVFANSNSGTYIDFNSDDFGDDTERIEKLLAGYPNVTILTSHTHWAVDLNDWSVEHRFGPTSERAPTIVNTAAVTTQYGPSGDWGETAVEGTDPVGLRVALYDDRLRVTAYGFDGSGEGTELKHIDVALPVAEEEPGDGDEDGGDAGAEDGVEDAGDGSGAGDAATDVAEQGAAEAGPADEGGHGAGGAGDGDLAPTGGRMTAGAVLAALALLAGGGVLIALRRRAIAGR